MTTIHGFLLGILQGIAEFLPISSSGHLIIAQKLFGLEDVPLLFDIFLHLATLAAVCIFFRHEIWELLKCLGRWISRKQTKTINYKKEEMDILCNNEQQGHNTIIAVIVATIVTGIIGIITNYFIDDLPVKFICAGFIVTAALLILSAIKQKSASYVEKTSNLETTKKGISIPQAMLIGLMQGLGTLPGVSRSGSTIAGATFCNIDRNTAGSFSFILSIPAILGAFVLDLKDLAKVSATINVLSIITGCITAFVVGYMALSVLMKIIKKGKLQRFAAYLIPAGILGLIFL